MNKIILTSLAFLVIATLAHALHGHRNAGKLSSASNSYSCNITAVKSLKKGQVRERVYWKIEIFDKNNKLQFEEIDHNLMANFSIYWGWEGDVLWLYSSDDGKVTRWSLSDSGWIKSSGMKKSEMPAHLLPEK